MIKIISYYSVFWVLSVTNPTKVWFDTKMTLHHSQNPPPHPTSETHCVVVVMILSSDYNNLPLHNAMTINDNTNDNFNDNYKDNIMDNFKENIKDNFM